LAVRQPNESLGPPTPVIDVVDESFDHVIDPVQLRFGDGAACARVTRGDSSSVHPAKHRREVTTYDAPLCERVRSANAGLMPTHPALGHRDPRCLSELIDCEFKRGVVVVDCVTAEAGLA
jgi:hypothetical protein